MLSCVGFTMPAERLLRWNRLEAKRHTLTVTPELKMDPVSLTLSVVGDCTLGTDEYFDYDTSLNAYYENYGADYFMANVKSIFSKDDLTIANFEGTLTCQ